jgi:hypothetical protein
MIQDGSSFALKHELRGVFPGRFTTKEPAAVELHVTYSGFSDEGSVVELAPDTKAERDFLPKPSALKDKLLLADRGCPRVRYFSAVQGSGLDLRPVPVGVVAEVAVEAEAVNDRGESSSVPEWHFGRLDRSLAGSLEVVGRKPGDRDGVAVPQEEPCDRLGRGRVAGLGRKVWRCRRRRSVAGSRRWPASWRTRPAVRSRQSGFSASATAILT